MKRRYRAVNVVKQMTNCVNVSQR